MNAFLIVVGVTIVLSFLCSMLEAMILSLSGAEIAYAKQINPKMGALLEQFKEQLEETISAILSLNTFVNTVGASLAGSLASRLWGSRYEVPVAVLMAFSILVLSEIIPKNIGVIYRRKLQLILIYPLWMIRFFMYPIAWGCKRVLDLILRSKPTPEQGDQEIIFLADKSAKEGRLSFKERDMILNTLSLDKLLVGDILTPRTVVTALEQSLKVSDVFTEIPTLPFSRIPVYQETIDNIVGIVRRRDLLVSKADGKMDRPVRELMQGAVFIPEHATVADALEQLLKAHQQLAIVVDEFGSMTGVVTLEDVFEQLLGKEIFEPDDLAVDMRELARRKQKPRSKP